MLITCQHIYDDPVHIAGGPLQQAEAIIKLPLHNQCGVQVQQCIVGTMSLLLYAPW